jgi:hypothetical protein
MSHREFQFQQVFLVFCIVFGGSFQSGAGSARVQVVRKFMNSLLDELGTNLHKEIKCSA